MIEIVSGLSPAISRWLHVRSLLISGRTRHYLPTASCGVKLAKLGTVSDFKVLKFMPGLRYAMRASWHPDDSARASLWRGILYQEVESAVACRFRPFAPLCL